jgi:hypothetical protein
MVQLMQDLTLIFKKKPKYNVKMCSDLLYYAKNSKFKNNVLH